jgi:hypothetical protein
MGWIATISWRTRYLNEEDFKREILARRIYDELRRTG